MYDYREAIKEDVKDYIRENYYKQVTEFDEQCLYDDLMVEDSVTGNASGSYTFDTEKAHENVFGNEHLLQEALEEFGYSASAIVDHFTDYEWQDVLIRCYLLGECIGEAVKEMVEDGELEDDFSLNYDDEEFDDENDEYYDE